MQQVDDELRFVLIRLQVIDEWNKTIDSVQEIMMDKHHFYELWIASINPRLLNIPKVMFQSYYFQMPSANQTISSSSQLIALFPNRFSITFM